MTDFNNENQYGVFDGTSNTSFFGGMIQQKTNKTNGYAVFNPIKGNLTSKNTNSGNQYGYAVFNPSKRNSTVKNTNNVNKYGYAVFNPSKANLTMQNTNNVNKYGYAVFNPSKGNSTVKNTNYANKYGYAVFNSSKGNSTVKNTNNVNKYGYAVFNPSKENLTSKNANNVNKYGYAIFSPQITKKGGYEVFNPSIENSTTKNTNNVNAELQQKTFNANNVFTNFNLQQSENINELKDVKNEFRPIEKQKAMTKQGLWSKIRAFLFQEIDLTAPIKVELTPYQQKVEDEINEFLHQEVSFNGISKFFGFKK